ncbi:MAG: YpdA family putative bacillithiol disulfide reductase [Cyclobacteriaceae bacterium]|nr:YpdA family putative bacillithiol disulfide reductase [Cyclobacteriaceae bacterium]
MEKSNNIDIAIIGAGPIGLACGIEAKKAGLSYVIIDKGCLVNSIYNYPFNMTFFSTSEKLEIGEVPFISHGGKPNRAEALEYYRRVCSSWDLNVRLYEKVREINPEKLHKTIHTDKGTYRAQNVILATGFYDLPFLMNVEGEDLPKVKHYYDEPHPYFKQDIVVVGAANSAVDVALETWRKGANVTMVVREPNIQDNVKYWVKPDIENRIKDGDITAYFNSSIKKITPITVEIETPEGKKELKNDFVLAMTGYKPDFTFMKNMGITFGNDPYRTPEYHEDTNETKVEGIYLAGVACGGLHTNKWFIENSRVHAEIIIRHILSKGK